MWSTLGQSLMKHGEWQEASLAFRAALKQRPERLRLRRSGLPTRWTDCTAGRSCSDASRRFDVNVAEQPTTVVPSHPEASTSGAFLMHKKNACSYYGAGVKQSVATSGCFTQRCVHGV
ncbi:hypothetical protein ACLBR5_02295 [Escherichia coli]